MWKAWDLTLDICLTQLPELGDDPNAEFKQHSPFFAEQLTAFEVWLEFGTETKKAPEQLPVVLQVCITFYLFTKRLISFLTGAAFSISSSESSSSVESLP